MLQKIACDRITASHVATIFCNHLAKLLQKIIASQKNQHTPLACYYIFAKFMLPKRRFWMAERTFGNAFSKYFSKGEYSIWLRSFEKCFENAFPNVRSDFQNLRLGSIKLLQNIVAYQKTNTSHVSTIV